MLWCWFGMLIGFGTYCLARRDAQIGRLYVPVIPVMPVVPNIPIIPNIPHIFNISVLYFLKILNFEHKTRIINFFSYFWAMNPYHGCEHGCIYCYARNSHQYWGFSAGLDFERKIIIKENAPELLEQFLKKYKGIPQPIMFSGNSDINIALQVKRFFL